MTESPLTAEAVETTFAYCLWRTKEPENQRLEVEGLQANRVLFHRQRVDEKREAIRAMLAELPEQFRADHGGGCSVLNACQDRQGRQWADLHRTMAWLFEVGIAAGLARWTMPRSFWRTFPGEMPYVTVMV